MCTLVLLILVDFSSLGGQWPRDIQYFSYCIVRPLCFLLLVFFFVFFLALTFKHIFCTYDFE